jgi:hypothetical protein
MNYIGFYGPQTAAYDSRVVEMLLRHDLKSHAVNDSTVVCIAGDSIAKILLSTAHDLGFKTLVIEDRQAPTTNLGASTRLLVSDVDEGFIQTANVIYNYGMRLLRQLSLVEATSKTIKHRNVTNVYVAGSAQAVWFPNRCAYVTVLSNTMDNRIRSWVVRDLLRLRQYSRQQATPLAVVSTFNGPLKELSEIAKQLGLLRLRVSTEWVQQDADRFCILSGITPDSVQSAADVIISYVDESPVITEAEYNGKSVFKRLDTLDKVYPKEKTQPDAIDTPSQDRPFDYVTFEWEPLEERVPYREMELKYPKPAEDHDAYTPSYRTPSSR